MQTALPVVCIFILFIMKQKLFLAIIMLFFGKVNSQQSIRIGVDILSPGINLEYCFNSKHSLLFSNSIYPVVGFQHSSSNITYTSGWNTLSYLHYKYRFDFF